eukprot:m.113569 g.113569  ORF g.113569 m.113569 type:complete len:230 (-) comp12798_c2_seq1:214-903(-)
MKNVIFSGSQSVPASQREEATSIASIFGDEHNSGEGDITDMDTTASTPFNPIKEAKEEVKVRQERKRRGIFPGDIRTDVHDIVYPDDNVPEPVSYDIQRMSTALDRYDNRGDYDTLRIGEKDFDTVLDDEEELHNEIEAQSRALVMLQEIEGYENARSIQQTKYDMLQDKYGNKQPLHTTSNPKQRRKRRTRVKTKARTSVSFKRSNEDEEKEDDNKAKKTKTAKTAKI